MRKLVLVHKSGGRTLAKLVLEPGSEALTIGTSPNCNYRVRGDDVSPIHCMLEWRNGVWVLLDLGSATGTWSNDKGIVEKEITESSTVLVGGHEFHLEVKAPARELYKNFEPSHANSDRFVHQVLIKRNGVLVDHSLLPDGSTYELLSNGSTLSYPCPKGLEPVETKWNDFEIHQQRVEAPEKAKPETYKLDLRTKWLSGGAVAFLVTAFIVLVMAPKEPDVALDLPEIKNNKYARMIFDAKITQEQKKQAQTIVKNRASSGGPAAKSQAKAESRPTGKTEGAKVVSKIKSSGLSQLIGKIAKRTSDHIAKTQFQGVTPDNVNSGRALASIGGSHTIQGVATGAGSYQLKSVGTEGKGGGSSNYKDGVGLSKGAEGIGDVGIIEEETEVEGGLDRSIIAEIIEKNLGQIRYCYERQLSADPSLYGKVMIKFDIGAEGQVTTQTVGQTTLKNAMIEGCILRRVARWQFPQPKGGTTVRVTYPFLFKSNQ
jgi:TonB family protein